MTPRELPDLEQTLGDLVLELLRAPAEYPELILSAPSDGHGKYAPEAVRVTYHYTMALLAYGYSPEQEELRAAADWFATPFPNDHQRRIDATEMNRLEVLMALRPHDPFVQPRLAQLVQQRTALGHFDIQAGDPVFETLLAIKVIRQAGQAGVLNGLTTPSDLKKQTNALLKGNHRDKDLALALRLRCEIDDGLTLQQQKSHLTRLLDVAEKGGGLWGLSKDMEWLADNMYRGQFTPGQVADHREIVREMLISTCYVIENLMPLVKLYPQIEPVLKRAVEMWWNVFHGKGAVETLRGLFPVGYDLLPILCRTLISLRAYLGEPLIGWGAAHIQRQMASQNARPVDSPDHQSIRQALKNWIHIDLDKAFEPLRLGMSDTNVVRIHPRIMNPMQPDDDGFRINIPNADTLVVKYGPVDEIDRERDNYANLPKSIRDSFVNIPQPSYTDESRRRAFVIMADLNRYRTLSDALLKVPQIHDALVRELGSFLLRVHLGEPRQKRATQEGLLLYLYLLPMQQHVRRIFTYILENKLLEGEHARHAGQVQRALLDLIGSLVQRQLELEDFLMACMHGDLHSRNIMVRRLKQNENSETGGEVDFKLIDLEKFQRSGDAALDAGELLVDLELLRAPRNAPPDRDPIAALMVAVQNAYRGFAEEREDALFPVRVRLGQARALIRVAKGRTKQGELSLREARRGPAVGIAFEALSLAEAALAHLQATVGEL